MAGGFKRRDYNHHKKRQHNNIDPQEDECVDDLLIAATYAFATAPISAAKTFSSDQVSSEFNNTTSRTKDNQSHDDNNENDNDDDNEIDIDSVTESTESDQANAEKAIETPDNIDLLLGSSQCNEDPYVKEKDNKNEDDESDVDLTEQLARMIDVDDEDDDGNWNRKNHLGVNNNNNNNNIPKTANEVDGYHADIQQLESVMQFSLQVTPETHTNGTSDGRSHPPLMELDMTLLLSKPAGHIIQYIAEDRTVIIQSNATQLVGGGGAGEKGIILDEGTLLFVQTQDTSDINNDNNNNNNNNNEDNNKALFPLGKIFEVFGPICQPLYSIRLPAPKPSSQVNKKSNQQKKSSKKKKKQQQLQAKKTEAMNHSSEIKSSVDEDDVTSEVRKDNSILQVTSPDSLTELNILNEEECKHEQNHQDMECNNSTNTTDRGELTLDARNETSDVVNEGTKQAEASSSIAAQEYQNNKSQENDKEESLALIEKSHVSEDTILTNSENDCTKMQQAVDATTEKEEKDSLENTHVSTVEISNSFEVGTLVNTENNVTNIHPPLDTISDSDSPADNNLVLHALSVDPSDTASNPDVDKPIPVCSSNAVMNNDEETSLGNKTIDIALEEKEDESKQTIDPWSSNGEYGKLILSKLKRKECFPVFYIPDDYKKYDTKTPPPAFAVGKILDTASILRNNRRGCDASNVYDEEIGDDNVHEMDFSDDEQERMAKNKGKSKTISAQRHQQQGQTSCHSNYSAGGKKNYTPNHPEARNTERRVSYRNHNNQGGQFSRHQKQQISVASASLPGNQTYHPTITSSSSSTPMNQMNPSVPYQPQMMPYTSSSPIHYQPRPSSSPLGGNITYSATGAVPTTPSYYSSNYCFAQQQLQQTQQYYFGGPALPQQQYPAHYGCYQQGVVPPPPPPPPSGTASMQNKEEESDTVYYDY